MIDHTIDHTIDRTIDHTLKWDTSPFGPWCCHSFHGPGWEVTAEPYLFGDTDEPFGCYTVKTFFEKKELDHRVEAFMPIRTVGQNLEVQNLDPPNAMFLLCALLQALGGWPVLVRWVPRVEMVVAERKVVSVMLHMVGQGYVMTNETYQQLKPRLQARYGDLPETVRPPTVEEQELHDKIKAMMEGGA